jgi:hypothetical protein
VTKQTQQEAPQPAPAPEQEGANPQQQQKQFTLAERKAAIGRAISKTLTQPLMEERLMKMAGGDASRVAKNLTAFLTLIQQDDGSGQPKKYLCDCSVASLVMCFLESVTMQLPYDSRKLITPIAYDGVAENDISYKGFVNSLSKHYRDAYVDAKIIMVGDEFECEEMPECVSFRHKRINNFAQVSKDMKEVAGAYCYFSYLKSTGETVQRIVQIGKQDLLIIRSKAKTTKVWDEFTSEQILKSIIRRAAKLPFAAIDLDIDIEEVDNRNYELNKPTGNLRLQQLMEAQQEQVNEDKGDKNPQPKMDGTVGDSAGTPAGENADAKPEAPAEAAKEGFQDGVVSDPAQKKPENDDKAQSPAVQRETVTDATYEEVTGHLDNQPEGDSDHSANTSGAWDGSTVYVGDGKRARKDFATPQTALVYIRKVISQRKTKKSRQDIIDGNSLLIGAVIKGGNKEVVNELTKLANEGA